MALKHLADLFTWERGHLGKVRCSGRHFYTFFGGMMEFEKFQRIIQYINIVHCCFRTNCNYFSVAGYGKVFLKTKWASRLQSSYPPMSYRWIAIKLFSILQSVFFFFMSPSSCKFVMAQCTTLYLRTNVICEFRYSMGRIFILLTQAIMLRQNYYLLSSNVVSSRVYHN